MLMLNMDLVVCALRLCNMRYRIVFDANSGSRVRFVLVGGVIVV